MTDTDSYVNLGNTRSKDQLRVMQDIQKSQECPFCPENLEKYHKQPVFKKGAHWILTRNQWPYENTDQHLLAIASYHAERFSDLKPGSFDELQEQISWAISEFKIAAGGLAMRFGDTSRNGATVRHLHAHLIVPKLDLPPEDKVRFKIS